MVSSTTSVTARQARPQFSRRPSKFCESCRHRPFLVEHFVQVDSVFTLFSIARCMPLAAASTAGCSARCTITATVRVLMRSSSATRQRSTPFQAQCPGPSPLPSRSGQRGLIVPRAGTARCCSSLYLHTTPKSARALSPPLRTCFLGLKALGSPLGHLL